MKKWVKILVYIHIGIILSIAIIMGFYFWKPFDKNEVTKEKYPHYVGYIDQEKALLNTSNKLCNENRIAYVYNGAAFRAYKKSKKIFRENITKAYKNRGYTDSGYLNFRFLVNCEGKAGWFEIIEMNLDLLQINLNDGMVEQLLHITSQPNHWNVLSFDNTPFDYYMYISYRIENGEIVEILP
nr:hypothetical protein [uncultured Allomuricauda sp.]